MNILVAVCAIGKYNAAESQIAVIIHKKVISRRWVAFVAGCGLVFSDQRKFGFAVIKLGRRFPAIHRMAFQTVLFHLSAMLIMMTGKAVLRQTQKCTGQIFTFFLQRDGIGDM